MEKRIDLDALVANKIITKAQAEKILSFNQSKNISKAWKLMYWISGLFIGLGTILLISANWDNIPDWIKLVADFTVLGAVLYGAYWSIVNKKDNFRELFLTLSLLFVGATIGLIAQIYNLSGGWQSFALAWSMLSLPLALLSRLTIINIVWLCLFVSAINFGFVEKFVRYVAEYYGDLTLLIMLSIFLACLAYLGRWIYETINKKVVMPKAFYLLSILGMYWISIFGGAAIGFVNNWANVFVFVFLACRLLLAIKDKNMQSFIRNMHGVELYILFLFFSRFNNLFDTGVGFIFAGFLLLALIYVFRKTSNYIKKLEIFNV